MATLIKKRRIVADSWRLFELGADCTLPEVLAAGDVIVPLAVWQARREALLARADRIGVWLDSSEGPETIAGDLEYFAVIAMKFPEFADGRGYSTARLLRDRYRFAGELRAFGDVLRDQLPFLEQCGFDAFALRDDQDAEQALRAFDDFSEAYQASATQPVPLFRRRLATETTS
jgi:uncharacterized protein (DUF934 family)